MNKLPFKLILIFFSFFVACGQQPKSYWTELPPAKGWVNDFENIFTSKQIKILDSLLVDYERETTNEIAIITIPDYATDKARFDELTLLIAQEWAFGKEGKDNGILIGISKGHRRIRIQNGNGIEKLLTDDKTKQIIEQTIIPAFKEDNFFKGVFDGVQEIKMALDVSSDPSTVNLNELTVFQFIELLKIGKRKQKQLNILTVGMEAPKDWVTEKDIDGLMTYINSTEPAKCVNQFISSFLPIGESSTVGGHAMDIIEAFKEKRAYPFRLSSCPMTDQERIASLKKWWNEQKR